jgi:NADH-quinone oxidoreductase subunit H
MGDPVNLIANWLNLLLSGWGLPAGLITFILKVIGVVVVASVMLVIDILLVWVERKLVARFQDRLGPNRLGPYGLVQPIADVIKLLIKEDITPVGADKFIYNLAPIMALATVLLMWAVIPFAPTIFGSNVNIAVLYIIAVGGIGTLGIIMAGWAANNKYALLGALRMVAMVISYEVPMVIALLVPVILSHSMGLQDIVAAQGKVWFIFMAPLAALIFYITSIAELGRAPFDLNEAESEIVAGFHIEYTGMKFGLFYAGELLHALTASILVATLFLGGWWGPYVEQVPILGVLYLFFKGFLVYWTITWVRYSFPRLRIDQVMDFCWKFLTPLALVVLIVTALLDKAFVNATLMVNVLVQLAANLFIILVTLQIIRTYAKRERRHVSESRPVATAPMPDFQGPVMIEEE